ncbi:MAG: methyltransferase domain-containing protein [Selenomonadaceae bacterium]|nr:methyltransferase domain-containing protein [Selenomonadaceae bacterium]
MRDINAYAKEYTSGKTSAFEIKLSEYRTKRSISIIQKYDHKNLIEVGCALWPIACYVDDIKKYVLVEPADEYMQNAREKLKSKNAIFVKGFFEDKFDQLADIFSNDGVDFVLLSGLLHEVENPKDLLRTAMNLMNSKTVTLITVPNAKSFHRLLALKSGLIKSIYDFGDTNIRLQQHFVFDMDSFSQMLFDVSSELNKKVNILEKGSFFVKPFTHKQMQQC